MKRTKDLLMLLIVIMMSITTQAQKYKPTVSILGDSYSTYQGYITPASNEMWYFQPWIDKRTDVTDVKQTWWWQFINDNGFRLERNNSYSGSTICYTGYNGDDYTKRSFITRADNLGSPDIILVFGGTNDSWANSPIGEFKYTGWTQEDLKAYRPAVEYLANYIYNRYPNTDVYFIINDGLKDDIVQGQIDVCNRYGFKYILLQNIGKTTGHPNIAGMKQIAEQVAKVVLQEG